MRGMARSLMIEFAAGLCGGGWLHSQEWLCYLRCGAVGDDRVFGWVVLGWVAAQAGVGVPRWTRASPGD